jgi:hypothetical protein
MTTVMRNYPSAKGKMSVAPVQWLPGALSAMLPYFAMEDPSTGVLSLRADDPNLYGVYTGGLITSPVITKNNNIQAANKGRNFYTAPWCISTLPSRDVGRRVEVTSVDSGVTDYISALYSLIGSTQISLSNWRFEQKGYAKCYQVLQGNSYVNVDGTVYFGVAALPNTQVSGVPDLNPVASPLITNDFTFNGSNITTWQMPYNTYYAIDTPVVLSAVDIAHPKQPRMYFTLLNQATLYNNPNYSG